MRIPPELTLPGKTLLHHRRSGMGVAADDTVRGSERNYTAAVPALPLRVLRGRASGATAAGGLDFPKGPDALLLEFQNGGPVPEDMLPAMFEPFHGSAEKRTAASSGLGLGLFISKQIVLAHGGTIDVVSSGAFGTRVVVALPRGSGTRPADASFLAVSPQGAS